MFEKIVKNLEELNSVAVHLRNIRNFDDLRHLAEEWLVPEKEIEDFISGKRYRLTETKIEEKEFSTAEEKLREEMWILKDKEFADILAQHLIKKCEDDSFSSQVLQHHKTLQKCLNYVMEKAYHIAEEKRKNQNEAPEQHNQSVGLALSYIQVYAWAEEYYALDDAAEEKKKWEKTKKELLAKRKKEMERKEQDAKIKKNQGAVEKKKEDTQLSIFDLMNGGSDGSKEKKHESV